MRFDGPLIAQKIVRTNPASFLGIHYKKTTHLWLILQPFRFYYDDNNPKRFILVEAGWESDLASVPKFLGSFIQKDGVFTQAAVAHDWSYKNRGDVVYEETVFGTIKKIEPLTRKQQDQAFEDGMQVLGTNLPTRFIMWRAVRRFGWISYPKEK